MAMALALSVPTACQKKYCWTCSTVTYTRTAPSGSIFTGYTNDTTTNNFTECDKTASQIAVFDKTTSSDLTEGNIIVNTITTTTCNQ
jgi:hypothetical protein